LGSDLLSKGLAVAVIVLFLGVNVITDVIGDRPTFVNIIYVDDDNTEGPWDGTQEHPYQHVKEGIYNASNGDTIFVYNGIYYENIIIDKIINLVGENWHNTIIDANGSGNIVEISVDMVNISGFNFQNSGSNKDDNTIEIHSNYNRIFLNYIESHQNCGIFLTSSSHNNVIEGNIIDSSDYSGIYLCNSNNNIILGNNISNNTRGINLLNSRNNSIYNNSVYFNNVYGICFWSFSCQNTLLGNTVISNNNKGIYFSYSCDNILYHNNFINGTINTLGECHNIWNDDYPSGGNFWSGYKGVDKYSGYNQDMLGSDGIGDTSHIISGGKDNYPLMLPFGENMPIANFTYFVDDLTVSFDASSSFDRDGSIILYEWNLDDNTTGTGMIYNHVYVEYGIYNVKLTVIDNNRFYNNVSKIIVIFEDVPPNRPDKPSGNTSGKAGEEYIYSTSTTDPDGDQIWYKWDWGDEISGWIGPYDSGKICGASHTWDEKGSYEIKVKAKDVHDEESPWSNPLPIKMLKNKAINTSFLRFLENHPNMFPLLRQILRL
jgi:parallel beta-helix repeat protein